jgi:hypothetical protein
MQPISPITSGNRLRLSEYAGLFYGVSQFAVMVLDLAS